MARPALQPQSSPLDTGLRLALRYPLPAPKLRRRFPQPGEGTTQVPGVRGGMAARGPLRWGENAHPQVDGSAPGRRLISYPAFGLCKLRPPSDRPYLQAHAPPFYLGP